MACLRLFTVPPFPPLPDLSVPFFSRCIALSTLFPAAFPYFAIVSSLNRINLNGIDIERETSTPRLEQMPEQLKRRGNLFLGNFLTRIRSVLYADLRNRNGPVRLSRFD